MSEIYEVIGIIVAITGSIIIPIWLAIRPQDIPHKLIRYDGTVDKPIKSKIALEVSHPDKSIKKCRIIYKGTELFCDGKPNQKGVTVLAGESALFRVPLGFEDENAKISVKNGWHTLQKAKLRTIEQRYHHPPKVFHA
jgi:hypothetical protein